MRRRTAATKWIGTALAVGGLVLLAVPTLAKDAEKERPPIVDERADALLKKMGSTLAAAKQFSFRAEITFDEMLPSEQMIQLAALEDVAVRRPNRAYVEYLGDLGAKQFWYDGKHATIFDAPEKVYASTAVPGKLDAAIDQLREKQGFQPPLADLLYSNPYTVLKQHAQFGIDLGLHDAAGVTCHHLAFVDKTFDWQIWIEDGDKALPRKLLIIYKQLPGSPRFEALLSDWNLNENLADAVFTPVIPEGTTQIDFATVKQEAGGR